MFTLASPLSAFSLAPCRLVPLGLKNRHKKANHVQILTGPQDRSLLPSAIVPLELSGPWTAFSCAERRTESRETGEDGCGECAYVIGGGARGIITGQDNTVAGVRETSS